MQPQVLRLPVFGDQEARQLRREELATLAGSASTTARGESQHAGALRGHLGLACGAGGQKTFRHPLVGTIVLGYQSLQVEGSAGQRLGVFTAEPGTPDYEAIVVLDGMAGQDAGHPVVDATS
ncbi:hypothetical protein ACFV0W_27045 [Streptomyces anulatus]